MPVCGIHVEGAHDNYEKHNRDFENHHRGIKSRALSNADNQNNCDQGDNHHGRQIQKLAGRNQLS